MGEGDSWRVLLVGCDNLLQFASGNEMLGGAVEGNRNTLIFERWA